MDAEIQPTSNFSPERITAKAPAGYPLFRWLFLSFALFAGSFVVDQAFRWTDSMKGIQNGLYHAPLLGISWLVFGLLPALAIHGLYRWRRWHRFRVPLLLLPGIVPVALVTANLIFDPQTPAQRFKQFTGVDLPASTLDLRAHFSGGGIADYTDCYYFRCSSEDTNRLIEALHRISEPTAPTSSGFERAPFPNWPDPSTWNRTERYSGWWNHEVWGYDLITDHDRKQVCLYIWCI